MIASLVLVALLVELALYAAIGHWLWRACDVPITVIAVAVVAAFLALRVTLVALACALARRWRAAASAPLGAAGFLRLVAGETRAFLQTFVLGQVLQPWLAPCVPKRIVPGVTPVVFVHGIYCNAGVWHRQLAQLQREGMTNLFCVNLGPPLSSIDHFSSQLARRVAEVCQACAATKAIIVAHSMGGLVARAWRVRQGGDTRTARLVTIGSPHRGSRLARLVPGHGASQMVPGSEWLSRLEADEAATPGVPTTCIFSWHDTLVAPQDSALLPGVGILALERLGHLGLLLDATVQRRVGEEIAAARSESPS